MELKEFRKAQIEFLNMPFNRKFEIVKSVIGINNGIGYLELIEKTKSITLQFSRSIQRELDKQDARKNLVYRNYPNISKRK